MYNVFETSFKLTTEHTKTFQIQYFELLQQEINGNKMEIISDSLSFVYYLWVTYQQYQETTLKLGSWNVNIKRCK